MNCWMLKLESLLCLAPSKDSVCWTHIATEMDLHSIVNLRPIAMLKESHLVGEMSMETHWIANGLFFLLNELTLSGWISLDFLLDTTI